jgi:hypothetical protein
MIAIGRGAFHVISLKVSEGGDACGIKRKRTTSLKVARDRDANQKMLANTTLFIFAMSA